MSSVYLPFLEPAASHQFIQQDDEQGASASCDVSVYLPAKAGLHSPTLKGWKAMLTML